jgi:hypothetical protein
MTFIRRRKNKMQRAIQKLMLLAVFSTMVIGLASGRAFAQAADGGGSDMSFFVGYMLPNQIDNVTQILPVFGGRYSLGIPNVGGLEFEGLNTHSNGVDFTSVAMSLRGEIPVIQGINALIYGGPDLHYYIPSGSSSRLTDYGVHFGVAGMMFVTDTLWLRSDLKFLGGPGTQLQLLFGLLFRGSGT